MRDGGKGDAQRPLTVSMEQFDNSWNVIFNKSKINVKDAFEESLKESEKFFEELRNHEKECGK